MKILMQKSVTSNCDGPLGSPENIKLATDSSVCLGLEKNAPGRINGFDLARGVAVLGMILVNLDSIFLGEFVLPLWYQKIVFFLYGRAAVLFVMLAGIGVGLMSWKFMLSKDPRELKLVRSSLFKRSAVLFIGGLFFLQFWASDILHFYGVFLVLAAFLVAASEVIILMLGIGIFFLGSLLYVINLGDPNLTQILEPMGSTFSSEIDDVLFSGQYALFPWLAFLLFGMWLVRKNTFHEPQKLKRAFAWSLAIFMVVECVSFVSSHYMVTNEDSIYLQYLSALLSSEVFPVSPFFALSAVSGGLVVICSLTLLSQNPKKLFSLSFLKDTGKLPLSIYISHIFIALWLEEFLLPHFSKPLLSSYALPFILFFIILTLVTSHMWFRKNSTGPLEWVMRKI